eukprot:TRINITY_DN3183_c0_g1_i2.p1 TRINITY_DN3183_c0_g1~~TRINITY_DN3183_c0_g1_i2.p1  ORF type:complete len:1079 (+),score=378.27 TRINITY_DN3183_c0_g1_i2:103-3339(+)
MDSTLFIDYDTDEQLMQALAGPECAVTWQTATEDLIIETASKVRSNTMFSHELAARVLHIALRPSVRYKYFEPFCTWALYKIEWDNVLCDLCMGISKPDLSDGYLTTGQIVPLFEIAGLTSITSKIGCGERFKPEAALALELLSELFDKDAGRKSFIVFKNTIEECESLVDRSFLVETANLEEHIKFNEGKRHVYKLVNLLNQIDYLDPESLILDRASLAEYRNNITEEKAKKEEAIAAWIEAQKKGEAALMEDEDDEEDEGGGEDAHDTWDEMLTARDNPGMIEDHASFKTDPMTIHDETTQDQKLKTIFLSPIHQDGKVVSRNALLYFREEFDPKLYLAHVHNLTTEWDVGLDGLRNNTERNVDSKKFEMAKQFRRYTRCKSTMDKLSGDSLKNDIQRPLSELEENFRLAHEQNRKSLHPIIEAQAGIEQQRRELSTVQKFRTEFERLQSIKLHMEGKSWSHVVNEYKVQKRKGNTGSKYGKMQEVSNKIDRLLDEARNALEHDFKTQFNVDATSIERKIQQLGDLDYPQPAQTWITNAMDSLFAVLNKLRDEFLEDMAQFRENERMEKRTLREEHEVVLGNTEESVVKKSKKVSRFDILRASIEADTWLEEVNRIKQFVQEASKVIEERLPLYNAVLNKLIAVPHSDKDVEQVLVRKMALEEKPKLLVATSLFCEIVQEAIGHGRVLDCQGDKVTQAKVQAIGMQIVNAPRMVVACIHGSANFEEITDKLQDLHHMVVEKYIDQGFDKIEKQLVVIHAAQTWEQDADTSHCTYMTIDFVSKLHASVDEAEALLLSQSCLIPKLVTRVGLRVMELFNIFLDNMHTLAFGGSVACKKMKKEHLRLLYLLNDLRVMKTDKLHAVINDYELSMNTQLDPHHKDTYYELSDCLEQLLLDRYVFLKAEKLNTLITLGITCSGFDWCKNEHDEITEPPFQVRSEVMEMLLTLVAVHSELYAHFASEKRETRGPYVRGIIQIVDSIATAFTVAARLPDKFSQDGAWQFLLDLKFVHNVVQKYRSDYAKQAFSDLENKFLGAAASKGQASRRQQVTREVEKIFNKTKISTEVLFQCLDIRRDMK